MFGSMSYFYKYVDVTIPKEGQLITDKESESSSLIPDNNDSKEKDSEVHQDSKSYNSESEF